MRMDPVLDKVANMILRGRIIKATRSDRNLVTADVETFPGSLHRDVPVFQNFGTASIPPANSRCVIVAINADADSYICVATQQQSTGSPTEGDVVVGSAKGAAVAVSESVAVTGDTSVKGSVAVEGDLEATGGAVRMQGTGFDAGESASLMDQLGLLCDQVAALATAAAQENGSTGAIAAPVQAIKASLLQIKGDA